MKGILIYLAGILTGAYCVLFSGVLSSAGEDLWKYLKNKIRPPEPEPLIVPEMFIPSDLSDRKKLQWVSDVKIVDWESKGYTFYRDGSGRKCKRQMRTVSKHYSEEFLMMLSNPTV